MKLPSANNVRFIKQPRRIEEGSVRTFMLVLVSFLLGVAVTAFWFKRSAETNSGNAASVTAMVQPSGQATAPAPGSAPAEATSAGSTPGESSSAVGSSTTVSPASPASPPSAPGMSATASSSPGMSSTGGASRTQSALGTSASMDPSIIEEVKKIVPNYASISLADAENILRAETLKEMEADVTAAQQQLQNSPNAPSAMDQVEKFKDMAAHLQAQIAALQNLKNQP